MQPEKPVSEEGRLLRALENQADATVGIVAELRELNEKTYVLTTKLHELIELAKQ